MPDQLTLADLDVIVLKAGAHAERGLDSVCVMEAVAWFAGREHTDRPPCVSKTIGSFLMAWNDAMNDADRQQLKLLIPRVVGTVGTSNQEMQRSYMALDWYCRAGSPAWLRLAGLTAEAEAIEATAPIVDSVSAAAAQAALNKARNAASAAGAAAWAAAWAAARDAARDAAGAAAWAAAWDAAWAAAGAAAWDAAWAAARDAARAAAWAAAWDAAGAAAWDAAWDAARAAAGAAAWAAAWDAAGAAAWDAAWDAAWAAARDAAGAAAGAAARDALRPTVEALQKSAIELVERMIAVTAQAA